MRSTLSIMRSRGRRLRSTLDHLADLVIVYLTDLHCPLPAAAKRFTQQMSCPCDGIVTLSSLTR